MRVLVVEDDEAISGFVRQGLSEAGYAVDVAQDDSKGLDYAIAADYDATVLDGLLPKGGGLSLLKDLRQWGFKRLFCY